MDNKLPSETPSLSGPISELTQPGAESPVGRFAGFTNEELCYTYFRLKALNAQYKKIHQQGYYWAYQPVGPNRREGICMHLNNEARRHLLLDDGYIAETSILEKLKPIVEIIIEQNPGWTPSYFNVPDLP